MKEEEYAKAAENEHEKMYYKYGEFNLFIVI